MDAIDQALYQEEQLHLLKSLQQAMATTRLNYSIRGDYSQGITYQPLDIVRFGSQYYIATAATDDAPLTSDSWSDLLDLMTPKQGPRGERGPLGDEGPRGERGEKGDTGHQGIQGDRGRAGERGPQGVPGPVGKAGVKGPKGDKGDEGKSAYEVWLSQGNKGGVVDFLNSLKVVSTLRSGGGSPITVNHGSNANVKRPGISLPVIWIGTVEPVNAIDSDLWIDNS